MENNNIVTNYFMHFHIGQNRKNWTKIKVKIYLPSVRIKKGPITCPLQKAKKKTLL